MAERPDLDLIEKRADNWDCTTWDVQRLLRYCRELEAENKRLQEFSGAACLMRDRMDGHYVSAEDMYVFDETRERTFDWE